ncbi:MAG: ABC transporter permease [Roseivirga sp.]
MLRNYLRTSFRYLANNKVYSLINVMGLAVGMACFMLLTIFVKQEFSYDEFHSKKDLIHQVFLADSNHLASEFKSATQAPAGPLLAEQIPEITSYARYFKESQKVSKVNGQRFLIDKLVYADAALFDLFDFPLLSTKGSDLKLSIDEVVISETEAKKLYGSADEAIGQVLDIVDVGELLIKDVFQDLPENTHLEFNYVISFERANKPFEGWSDKNVFNWGFLSAFSLYVELSDDAVDPAAVEPKIRKTLEPHQSKYGKLLPVPEIYFSELNTYAKKGNKQYMQLYLGIAMLILIVASVNYMNLATARLNKRSKEVGIRKTVGGNRRQIVRQFLVEALLISFAALVLSVCLAELSLPLITDLIGKSLDINYLDPAILSFMLLSGGLVGLISGFYPAFYLSRFNPVQILSGKTVSNRRFSFRQVLVGFQFFTCLGLMTATLIIFQQFKHMQQLDKGLDDAQVISVSLKDKGLQKNYNAFKAELSQNPGIKDVTGASFHVFSQSTSFFVEPEGTEGDRPVKLMSVERNFLTNLGIDLAAGEDFNQGNDALNNGVMLVNESAAEAFNWDEPLGKKILSYKVSGVTDDFLFGSAKDAIEPLMIIPKNEGFEHVYVKVTGDINSSLKRIEETFNKFSESYPFEYTFLDEDFARKYEKEQRLSEVFTVFSILAIFVAGLGILGLSIYIAEQRAKEIGIRRVLGAKTAHVIWLLNRNTTLLIGLVALIALPTVHLIMRGWVDDFANQIQLSLTVYVVPLVTLVSAVWLILLNQSFKSARQNPVKALRTE